MSLGSCLAGGAWVSHTVSPTASPTRYGILLTMSYLYQKYGLTEVQYSKMLALQGGVCAICGKPPKKRRLHTDHDHQTGRVRCLACMRCNRYKIGTNTPETARRVAEIVCSSFDGRTL